MDIYAFAMKMEKEGETFYRELAEKATDPGVQKILLLLAEDEVKHYKIFQDLKEKTPEVLETRILDNAKTVFETWREEKPDFSSLQSQKDFYRKAQELEKKSEEFYLQCAEEVEEKKAEVFRVLAEEERKHFFLLDHVLEILEKPDYFLEHAEAFRWDEY